MCSEEKNGKVDHQWCVGREAIRDRVFKADVLEPVTFGPKRH